MSRRVKKRDKSQLKCQHDSNGDVRQPSEPNDAQTLCNTVLFYFRAQALIYCWQQALSNKEGMVAEHMRDIAMTATLSFAMHAINRYIIVPYEPMLKHLPGYRWLQTMHSVNLGLGIQYAITDKFALAHDILPLFEPSTMVLKMFDAWYTGIKTSINIFQYAVAACLLPAALSVVAHMAKHLGLLSSMACNIYGSLMLSVAVVASTHADLTKTNGFSNSAWLISATVLTQKIAGKMPKTMSPSRFAAHAAFICLAAISSGYAYDDSRSFALAMLGQCLAWGSTAMSLRDVLSATEQYSMAGVSNTIGSA